jgi:hypothetical protein
VTPERSVPRTETCPTCGSVRIFDTALYERIVEAEAALPAAPALDPERLVRALRSLYTSRNYLGKRAEDDASAIAAAYERDGGQE